MIRLLLFTSLLLATAHCGDAVELDFNYFSSNLLKIRPKLKALLNSLQEISTSQRTPEEILDCLRSARSSFISLLRPLNPDGPFDSDLLVLLFNIKHLQRSIGSNTNEAKLIKRRQVLGHLEQLAEQTLRQHLQEPVEAIDGALVALARPKEREFDSFLLIGYNMGKANNGELLELAGKFTFSDPNFRASRLAERLDRGPNGEWPLYKSLVQHLIFICLNVQQPLGRTFDVYNVARAIEPELVADVPIRFRKLNEYHRICLSLQNGDTRAKTEAAIRANLRRGSGWFCG